MVDHDDDNDNTRTHVVLTDGTMVSHYRIVKKIGAGGMGEVYLAEDTKLKRRVALKFLPGHLVANKDVRTRFVREAQTLARLNHPNIISIYEVSEFNGRPYYAMELVEGQTLSDLAHGKPLPFDMIIEYAIQICQGLGEAHRAAIVHRDIKAANIAVDKQGRVRVLDFGLAASEGDEKLTKTGSTLGTVGYMSPEQVSGREIDHRSDLFSLGVVLYELIAGQTPFKRDNEGATLKAIIEDNPEPLTRYRSDVPEKLHDTVFKLLDKDKELRYQSAEGVIADLKRLMYDSHQTGHTQTIASRPRKTGYLIGAVASVAIVLASVLYFSFQPTADKVQNEDKVPMIAVLPFENLGSPDDEYFADGMTDEITSRLAMIKGLGVISRTSSMKYKVTDKSLKEIGAELGVAYILEGTVRWSKVGEQARVRITPQLIRVSDDRHLWASNYERALMEVFAVQADIAEKIVEQLGITLIETDKEALAHIPTENLEAYDYYLRGNQYLGRGYEGEDFRIAVEMFEEAIALDPNFALAYAALSKAHMALYWWNWDRSENRLRLAKQAVDKALEIVPESPEAHGALARYYYHGFRDYERALEETEIARNSQPNNFALYNTIGAIKRRQGKWDEAIKNFKHSIELNPRDALIFFELAITHSVMRNYEEAERLYDMALSLSPDLTIGYSFRCEMYLIWKGNTGEARQAIESAAGKVEMAQFTFDLSACDFLDRDYESALGRLSSFVKSTWKDSADYYLDKASVYRLLNDSVNSFACYDSARVFLEAQLADAPDSSFHQSRVAVAYAGLGHNEEAIRRALIAIEQLPISKDAFTGTFMLNKLAEVYIMVGEYDAALDQIEHLLSIPSLLSVPLLLLDPEFDPLRDHPRFKALIEKYNKESET